MLFAKPHTQISKPICHLSFSSGCKGPENGRWEGCCAFFCLLLLFKMETRPPLPLFHLAPTWIISDRVYFCSVVPRCCDASDFAHNLGQKKTRTYSSQQRPTVFSQGLFKSLIFRRTPVKKRNTTDFVPLSKK